MNLTSIKKYVAECIGTMVLVIFGCGTAMLTGPGSSGAAYIATALAFGLSIVAMAYSVGRVTGVQTWCSSDLRQHLGMPYQPRGIVRCIHYRRHQP